MPLTAGKGRIRVVVGLVLEKNNLLLWLWVTAAPFGWVVNFLKRTSSIVEVLSMRALSKFVFGVTSYPKYYFIRFKI